MEAEATDRRRSRLYRPQFSVPRRAVLFALSRLMPSKYPLFDRSRLRVKPLAERVHDLHLGHWMALGDPAPEFQHADLPKIAERLKSARAANAARVLLMGAHVIRAGVNRHIIDLMERGFIDHIAMNGAGPIHD